LFRLDPRLEESSRLLLALTLCEARLQDDARYPWIVLAPRRAGLREIEDLDPAAQTVLMGEIVAAGRAVRAVGAAIGFSVEKLNVGALGNIVSQLHVHVVGRRAGDAAWPGPVWGVGAAEPYGEGLLAGALDAARRALGGGAE
jgi:diadenosine tetraphosphate (Ap4A) HIT family hydrolase